MPMRLDQLGEFDSEFSRILEPTVTKNTLLYRGSRAVRIISSFFLGQGALQGVQVLIGLLLVRCLSVEAWAQFGLTSGFQLTMNTLMDLGISTTIIPLVGDRRNDRALVGRYVRATKHLRDRTFLILAPFATLAFVAITYRHHWHWYVITLLLASVLVALYSSGQLSCYSAPLFLFGRLRDFYLPQTLSGVGRLIAYVACWLTGILNAWVAAILMALNIAVNGSLLERKSRNYLEWPNHESPAIDQEVLRYVLPAIPAIVFAAFQAQISLFLISIFGNTVSIAQVAALSKLGQLFSVLMTFNVVVIEPYIARLSRERLLATYIGLVGLAALCCAPVILLGFSMPKLFLWLLGPKYGGLQGAVGWIVCGACINYIAGLMWIMNRARKWVFWRGTILEIVLLLVVQISFIVFVGVRSTQQAVLFTFVSSFCYLLAHGYIGIYGFLKGPRILPV
jgi:O-antigen/teichoic acid export membrane protein